MPDERTNPENPENTQESPRSGAENPSGSQWSEEEASKWVDIADPSSAPESGQL